MLLKQKRGNTLGGRNHMNLTVTHAIIILITVALVIGIGIYHSRSVKSAAGYSVGGRSAGVPLVAGTVVGGGATVGTAQLAYSFGLSAWWFTLGSGIAFIIMGIFYARRMRGTGLETIPQFLSLHYGKRAEELSSVISSIGILFSAVASCLPGIEIISSLFGLDPMISSVVLILLVIGYTFFGGMKSAAIGGILKMGIIWFALFIAGFEAFQAIYGTAAWDNMAPSEFSLFGRGFEPSMANLFSVIVGVLCTQTYIQCIFSASTPITAAFGCFAAALIVIPVGLPNVAIGMYMHAMDPDVMPILVLPAYLINHTGVFIGNLAMGSIILSLISGIGGLSLGIGTMIARDMLASILKIRDDHKLLVITKMTVLAVMILACLISIANRGSEVLVWNYLSMALRGGGIFIPFSLAVFLPGHLTKTWAVISMAGSTLAALLSATVIHLPMDPLFVGLIASAILIIPGLRLHGNPPDEGIVEEKV